MSEAITKALDDFERKERGIPQAHMAAQLVAELRAALSQPAPPVLERHLTVTTNESGEAVAVTWQDDEHRTLEVVWERKAQPAPLAGEVTDALLELVEAHEAPYPSEASGIEAQDAWATRRTDALEKARAILALRPQSQPAGFVAGPLVWNHRQSEATVKVTRETQPEYGFTHPIYAEPQAALRPQAVPMTDDTERLDYLQKRGATVDLVSGDSGFRPMRFRVGGLHASVSHDIRAAIDAALATHQPTKEAEKP